MEGIKFRDNAGFCEKRANLTNNSYSNDISVHTALIPTITL